MQQTSQPKETVSSESPLIIFVMDGLSVVASIIAVVQISAEVGKQIYKYAESVKASKEDIEKIVSQ
jgi:hypothetical protein